MSDTLLPIEKQKNKVQGWAVPSGESKGKLCLIRWLVTSPSKNNFQCSKNYANNCIYWCSVFCQIKESAWNIARNSEEHSNYAHCWWCQWRELILGSWACVQYGNFSVYTWKHNGKWWLTNSALMVLSTSYNPVFILLHTKSNRAPGFRNNGWMDFFFFLVDVKIM